MSLHGHIWISSKFEEKHNSTYCTGQHHYDKSIAKCVVKIQ